jgi:hypothetical protein
MLTASAGDLKRDHIADIDLIEALRAGKGDRTARCGRIASQVFFRRRYTIHPSSLALSLASFQARNSAALMEAGRVLPGQEGLAEWGTALFRGR